MSQCLLCLAGLILEITPQAISTKVRLPTVIRTLNAQSLKVSQSKKSEHLHRYNPNPSLSPPQTTTDVVQKNEVDVEEPTEDIPVNDLIASGDSETRQDVCSINFPPPRVKKYCEKYAMTCRLDLMRLCRR